MSNIQVTTAIFVFIWTSLSTTFLAYRQVNEIRNQILTGKIGNDKINSEHRLILFENDWKPQVKGIIFRSFVFCVLIGFLPFIANEDNKRLIWIITLVSFSIPIMTLTAGIYHYRNEGSIIQNIIDDNQTTILKGNEI